MCGRPRALNPCTLGPMTAHIPPTPPTSSSPIGPVSQLFCSFFPLFPFFPLHHGRSWPLNLTPSSIFSWAVTRSSIQSRHYPTLIYGPTGLHHPCLSWELYIDVCWCGSSMYYAPHCMLRNTRYCLSQNLVNFLAGNGLQCDHSCKFITGHSKKIWDLVLIDSIPPNKQISCSFPIALTARTSHLESTWMRLDELS